MASDRPFESTKGTLSSDASGTVVSLTQARVANVVQQTQSFNFRFVEQDDATDFRVQREKTRIAALGSSPEERVRYLREEVFITTPDVLHVITTIERLLDKGRSISGSGGMRITGAGGTGKDAIIRYLTRTYGPRLDGPVPRCPLVFVDCRAHFAPSAILKHFLTQLNAAYTNRQDLKDLEYILLAALNACSNVGFVFNETQHLMPVSRTRHRHTTRLAGEAGDWLKRLIDLTRRQFFFFGIEGWDEIFDLDGQLGTRVSNRYDIKPLSYDSIFVSVLSNLDASLPMPERANLAEKPLCWEIFCSSKGNWRRLIDILSTALLRASRRHATRIDRTDLSWAHFLHYGRGENPFGVPPEA